MTIARFGVIFLLLLATASISGEQIRRPEPYQESEFPAWTLPVRRFEIVFFGTLLITMLLPSLLGEAIGNGVEGKGILDPRPLNADVIAQRVGISLGLSGILAMIDLIIEQDRISLQQQRRQELLQQLEQQDG